MSVIDGETVRFVGGYYERKGSEITKYYMAGAARVAIRKYTIPQSMTVEYLLGDHLGSTSITADSNGAMISEMRYKPWGELRYTWTDASASTSPAYELTRYQYTGQYSYDVEFGLKYYGARWLDSTTGRFTQPDTLVPDPNNPQSWDRFAYVGNNPTNNTDPDGRCWPICSALIGAAIGIGVQLVVHYQEHGTLANVSAKEILVAGAIGAVAGVVGGAIIPAAAALGEAAVTAAGLAGASSSVALAIGAGTELAAGVTMGGLSNVALANTQRVAMDAINGGDVSLDGVVSTVNENFRTDFSYGAAGYVMARGATAVADVLDPYMFKPNPDLINVLDPTYLVPLRPNPGQTIIPSTLYILATEILPNSTILECAFNKDSACRQ
ncbi:MAG: RHS repeat-associated core domain-containing protein [Anaerolineales bacterium]|nr:MAG: RHS repeat-associated core domain-containing protein [Anaerolineales bacterium]